MLISGYMLFSTVKNISPGLRSPDFCEFYSLTLLKRTGEKFERLIHLLEQFITDQEENKYMKALKSMKHKSIKHATFNTCRKNISNWPLFNILIA